MECFPVKDFWKHVIIINTHADTESKVFKHYMKNEFESMRKIISEQQELMDLFRISRLIFLDKN